MSASDWKPLEHHPSVGLSPPWHLGTSLSLKSLDDEDNDGSILKAQDAGS